jgi:ABC-2 type transport system permease protein
MPLILGVYIGFFTVINDPHGTVATVFSMIPLTSPIVMMMRIPFGVPWWQIASFNNVLLFGTFMLVSIMVRIKNLPRRNINVW